MPSNASSDALQSVSVALNYSERLHLLKLPSHELRRLHVDLSWCYKIIFGHVTHSPSDFFQLSLEYYTRTSLQNTQTAFQMYCKTEIFGGVPFHVFLTSSTH